MDGNLVVIFVMCLVHVTEEQGTFNSNDNRGDGTNATAKFPGFEFETKFPGVSFVPEFGNSQKKEDDEDYRDNEEKKGNDFINFNFGFRLPGNNKENQQNPGRGRSGNNGNGRGGNKKKKVPNPCGSRGRFCPRRNYIEEMGLNWSKRVQNGTGFFIRGPDGERQYRPIGYQEPNEKFGSCNTPTGDSGNCRHLEHCILEDFRSDFIRFLEYTCPIPYGDFEGVCCPEDVESERSFPTFPFPFPFPPSTTTQKPPQRQPNPSFSRTTTKRPSVPRFQCGISEQKTSRIVGGRIADPKAWIWMAALIRSMPEAGDVRVGQFCGGVLISEFHVLTAGHCVDAFQTKDIKIRLGEYNFSKTAESSSRADFNVASVKVHEQFNRYSYQNDIAIIKLTKSAFVNNKIRPICLPPPNDDESYVNEVGIVTGWGTIYYGGPTSNTLMEVSVPVWKQEDCQAAYTQPIEDTNLCAGVRSGSRDSCQGDSGGPLQLQGKDRFWRVIAIVSWGIRCSEPGYPGIYTRVSKYIDWIQSHL